MTELSPNEPIPLVEQFKTFHQLFREIKHHQDEPTDNTVAAHVVCIEDASRLRRLGHSVSEQALSRQRYLDTQVSQIDLMALARLIEAKIPPASNSLTDDDSAQITLYDREVTYTIGRILAHFCGHCTVQLNESNADFFKNMDYVELLDDPDMPIETPEYAITDEGALLMKDDTSPDFPIEKWLDLSDRIIADYLSTGLESGMHGSEVLFERRDQKIEQFIRELETGKFTMPLVNSIPISPPNHGLRLV